MGLLNWNFIEQNPHLVKQAGGAWKATADDIFRATGKLLDINKANQDIKESNSRIGVNNAQLGNIVTKTQGQQLENNWIPILKRSQVNNINANTNLTKAKTDQQGLLNWYDRKTLPKQADFLINKMKTDQKYYEPKMVADLNNTKSKTHFQNILNTINAVEATNKLYDSGINPTNVNYTQTGYHFLDSALQKQATFNSILNQLPEDPYKHEYLHKALNQGDKTQQFRSILEQLESKKAQQIKPEFFYKTTPEQQRSILFGQGLDINAIPEGEESVYYEAIRQGNGWVKDESGNYVFTPIPMQEINHIIRYMNNKHPNKIKNLSQQEIVDLHNEIEYLKNLQK